MRICPTQHSWRLRTACAHALPPLYIAIAVTVCNAKRDGTDMGLKKKLSKKPEWLPDWKDESKYPDPAKAVGRVWAWEFLRRNTQYQELWEEYAALPHGLVYSGHSAYALRDISERLEQDFGVRNPAPPAMTTTDPKFKWQPKFVNQKPMYWVLPVEVSKNDYYEIPEIYLEDPAEVIVKFDLRAQIGPQLDYVGELLKKQLKRLTRAKLLRGAPRARFENYRDYLRVLDAKLSGVTYKTMGAEILKVKDPGYQKTNATYAFKSATRLRDGDYRFLSGVGLK